MKRLSRLELSVIICSHNPREDYLRRTLDAMKRQTLSMDQWEFLLIDNASNEPLAGKWDLLWHPHARHVREDEIGLTPARLRGIREAKGGLLVFVDDDNVLDQDYLERSLLIAERMPILGCFGPGRLEPEFEEVPRNELQHYTPMLALRTIGETRWSNDPEDSWVPWGAGLVVRRCVAERYAAVVEVSPIRRSLGRQGEQLLSGEDDEVSWVACSMGMGRGLFPELKVTHLIDKRRVQRDYLLRLAEGHAYSRVLLHWEHGLKTEPPEAEPSVTSVIAAIVAFSPSRFFHESRRWKHWRARTPLARRFEQVRNTGVIRALEFIRMQKK